MHAIPQDIDLPLEIPLPDLSLTQDIDPSLLIPLPDLTVEATGDYPQLLDVTFGPIVTTIIGFQGDYAQLPEVTFGPTVRTIIGFQGDVPELEASILPVSRCGAIPGCHHDLFCM